MNGQDPEFDPPTLGGVLNSISYLLAHGVIALFTLLAVVLFVAVVIGISES